MDTTNRKAMDKMESAGNGAGAKFEHKAEAIGEHAHDTFASINHSLLKAIDQNRTIAQNLMRAMHEESLRFLNARLEHTSRAIERGRDCQGLSGFMSVQQDWLLDVARDYAELNKRFSEVFHDVTEHGIDGAVDAVTDTARTAKRDVPPGDRAAA